MIIGLTGKSGAGKDEVAKRLVLKHGFSRLAFADPLKIAARHIFGLSDAQLWGAEKDKIDPYWGMTPGQLMQRLGTECLRNGFAPVPGIGEDVWIKALFRKVEPGRDYVITDVRFPNEADEIKRWGGKIYRVIRPGHVSARAPHVSENALLDYETAGRIWNARTLEALYETVDLVMTQARWSEAA